MPTEASQARQTATMPGIVSDGMKIEKLYLYPIKSIRGIELDATTVTKYGFANDRCFMVLKPTKEDDGSTTYKNTAIANDNEMCRFFPAFDSSSSRDSFTVTFKPVDGSADKTISIPLEPETDDLALVDVLMHKSPTQAFLMPAKYNDWFTSCFGYDVVLAYIGNNTRDCRMTSSRYKAHETSNTSITNTATNWLSNVTSIITGNGAADDTSVLKFADVAPYLIVSSKSMADVWSRLPEGEKDTFDITKFRPNLIVSGAEKAWEEDYWAEISITAQDKEEPVKIECEHNCGRCRSINIDYATGAQGTGEAGKMLKKLASDRRVDQGTKWSPIFGRYSFLHPNSEGREIRVGDRVEVSRKNEGHTAFGECSHTLP